MKSLLASLIFFGVAYSFAQSHILPCTGHSNRDCFGWATGRSFEHDQFHPVCSAFMLQGQMNHIYFEWTASTNQSTLMAAKIIGWGTNGGNHVAFKEDSGGYTHVLGEGGNLLSGSYSEVLTQAAAYGAPTGFFVELMGPRMRDVTAQNTFGDTSHGGTISWGGSPNTQSFVHATQQTVTRVTGQVSAQNIKQKFVEWSNGGSMHQSTDAINFWVESSNPTYSAVHKNLYDVAFQYSKPTGTFSGTIVVGGQSQSTPTGTFEVAFLENISAVATTYFEFENVAFNFSNWSPSGGSNPDTSFTPSGSTQLYTVTANFTPTPRPPENLHSTGNVGDPVHLSWTSHSATSGVTEYQIWRKVKPKNQQEQPPQLRTTVPRTTSSYTDNSYTLTSGYTEDLVSYDIRARYNAGGVSAYANPNYVAVFAEESYKVNKKKSVTQLTGPTSFWLSAQPNPFNPSTQICYELPEPSSVRIEIYDATGRKLTALVDAQKPTGRFTILWNGRNDGGDPAASGVYYCRMTADPTSGGNAVVQTARLLLVK